MDHTTLKELAPVLIQGGFAVVSLVLAWVIYKLWEKNDQLQKEKTDAIASVQKEKDAAIANLQKEKDAIYTQVLAAAKEEQESQIELTKEIVGEMTKMRQTINSLTAKAGRGTAPAHPPENGD